MPNPGGTATGFGNLVRDVLIVKHFEIKEVTFFLLKTASDDGIYIMGGVFDSYGIGFLDKMDEYVNSNPPDAFNIRYVPSGSKRALYEQEDILMNANRWDGFILVVGVIAGSFLLNVRATAIKKRIFPRLSGDTRENNHQEKEK